MGMEFCDLIKLEIAEYTGLLKEFDEAMSDADDWPDTFDERMRLKRLVDKVRAHELKPVQDVHKIVKDIMTEELKRVSTIPYNSQEICMEFSKRVLRQLQKHIEAM